MAQSENRPDQQARSGRWESRKGVLRAVAQTAVYNAGVTAVCGLPFFAKLPPGLELGGGLSALLAWSSTAVVLNGIAALLAVLLLVPFGPFRTHRWLMLFPFALLNVLVFVDYYVLNWYGAHVNQAILIDLTTPAAGDSTQLGRGTWTTGLMLIAGIGLATWAATRWLPRILGGWMHERSRRRRWTGVAILLFALVAADKLVFAYSDAADITSYTRLRRILPFYTSVTMRKFFVRLGLEFDREGFAVNDIRDSTLNYPGEPLRWRPDAPRYNVVILMVESGRFDLMNDKTMPRVTAWSDAHIRGMQHISGGNASRYGVFTLLYGLQGSYWHPILAERRSPALLDTLMDAGYRFGIFSCTNLNFPEFRSTAFVRLTDAITDDYGQTGDRLTRDERMTDDILSFINRQGDKPWFAWAFYDASHQPFRYPAQDMIFPVEEDRPEINYFLDTSKDDLEVQFKRYRNALHYIDRQIARVLQTLEDRGLMDETIVVLAGDHGEEFGELGGFGHNRSFHRYQTQTLFAMHIPGEGPRRIEDLTSHLDVIPTIGDALGIANAPEVYSHGLDLLAQDPAARRYVVSASYAEMALVQRDAITVLGDAVYAGGVQLYDRDYHLRAEGGDAVRAKREVLNDARKERIRFLR